MDTKTVMRDNGRNAWRIWHAAWLLALMLTLAGCGGDGFTEQPAAAPTNTSRFLLAGAGSATAGSVIDIHSAAGTTLPGQSMEIPRDGVIAIATDDRGLIRLASFSLGGQDTLLDEASTATALVMMLAKMPETTSARTIAEAIPSLPGHARLVELVKSALLADQPVQDSPEVLDQVAIVASELAKAILSSGAAMERARSLPDREVRSPLPFELVSSFTWGQGVKLDESTSLLLQKTQSITNLFPMAWSVSAIDPQGAPIERKLLKPASLYARALPFLSSGESEMVIRRDIPYAVHLALDSQAKEYNVSLFYFLAMESLLGVGGQSINNEECRRALLQTLFDGATINDMLHARDAEEFFDAAISRAGELATGTALHLALVDCSLGVKQGVSKGLSAAFRLILAQYKRILGPAEWTLLAERMYTYFEASKQSIEPVKVCVDHQGGVMNCATRFDFPDGKLITVAGALIKDAVIAYTGQPGSESRTGVPRGLIFSGDNEPLILGGQGEFLVGGEGTLKVAVEDPFTGIRSTDLTVESVVPAFDPPLLFLNAGESALVMLLHPGSEQKPLAGFDLDLYDVSTEGPIAWSTSILSLIAPPTFNVRALSQPTETAYLTFTNKATGSKSRLPVERRAPPPPEIDPNYPPDPRQPTPLPPTTLPNATQLSATPFLVRDRNYEPYYPTPSNTITVGVRFSCQGLSCRQFADGRGQLIEWQSCQWTTRETDGTITNTTGSFRLTFTRSDLEGTHDRFDGAGFAGVFDIKPHTPTRITCAPTQYSFPYYTGESFVVNVAGFTFEY